MGMIHSYGVNQFKFDATDNVDSVFPGSQFDSDFAAAIRTLELERSFRRCTSHRPC
jgi:hypothetical protein